MHMLPVTVPWDVLCISMYSHSLCWIKSLFLYWFCVGEVLLSNAWFLLHPRILSVVMFFFLEVRIDPHVHNFICNFSSEAAIKCILILFIKSSCLLIKLFFYMATQAFL